jgi:hypothetical protein
MDAIAPAALPDGRARPKLQPGRARDRPPARRRTALAQSSTATCDRTADGKDLANMGTPKKSLETATFAGDELIASPIGDIELRHSDFDDDASRRLFDEMDYERACQACIWSTPLVRFTSWRDGQNRQDEPDHPLHHQLHQPGRRPAGGRLSGRPDGRNGIDSAPGEDRPRHPDQPLDLPLINALGTQRGSERTFGARHDFLPVWKQRLDARTLVTTSNSEVMK